MNLFRISADVLHLVAILLLIHKMRKQRSCAGISLKSQQLFAAAYSCRYVDIFWSWTGLWNFSLKIVFVVTSWSIVWLMRKPYKASYNREYDSFRQLFVFVPCVIVALLTALIRGDWAPFELLWSFSLWLEALAILPQLVMLQRTGEHEQFTLNYIFCLGLYRALYLVNWVYRAFTESHYHGEWLVWIAGLVQTAGFSDFIYEYLKSRWYGGSFHLPK